jgi:hypothetical protein
MYPSEAIVKTDKLLDEINRRVSKLREECKATEVQWHGLCRVGGKREDAAAEMLGNLRGHLDGISKFTADVSSQITAMVQDPFAGDNV